MAAVHLPNKMSVSDDPPRKRSSISRLIDPFRSNHGSRRSSVDSGRSSLDMEISPVSTSSSRKLSKAVATTSVDSVSDRAVRERNVLRKSSLNTTTSDPNQEWERDKQTGEVKDHTNMLHSLANENDVEITRQALERLETETPPRPATFISSKLPPKLWNRVLSDLSIPDKAAFAYSCKTFRNLVEENPWAPLNDPTNVRSRIDFLLRLDKQLPLHLLCFSCCKYHMRLSPGKETLKPTNIANPVFDCPYASSSDPTKKISRTRITFGRALPFTFAQLIMREHRFGPKYGVEVMQMGRRYKDREEVGQWQHQTRYAVIEDKLYMRVVSSVFAPPNLPPAGERHLLYSREDFVPFFSVCAHWRDGVLMPSVKCALSHIPKPLEGSGILRAGQELKAKIHRPSTHIVTLCENCRPQRRCPECPTEYLIEVRLSEDKNEKDPTKLFKHALTVTRWSELGDGTVPWGPEWAAVNAENEQPFNSWEAVGKRAISGVFESFFNPEQIPPARLMSLNPDGEKLGEKGHNWY